MKARAHLVAADNYLDAYESFVFENLARNIEIIRLKYNNFEEKL